MLSNHAYFSFNIYRKELLTSEGGGFDLTPPEDLSREEGGLESKCARS